MRASGESQALLQCRVELEQEFRGQRPYASTQLLDGDGCDVATVDQRVLGKPRGRLRHTHEYRQKALAFGGADRSNDGVGCIAVPDVVLDDDGRPRLLDPRPLAAFEVDLVDLPAPRRHVSPPATQPLRPSGAPNVDASCVTRPWRNTRGTAAPSRRALVASTSQRAPDPPPHSTTCVRSFGRRAVARRASWAS